MAALIVGCSSLGTSTESSAGTNQESSLANSSPRVLTADNDPSQAPSSVADASQDNTSPSSPLYSSETLANLLVAEVAAQRNALNVTMGYYGMEALRTEDPEVTKQAARLAAYLQDHLTAAQLGERWLEQEADDPEAHSVLVGAYLHLGDREQTLAHLDALLNHESEVALGQLVAELHGLDKEINVELVSILAELAEEHPQRAPLWYAKALVLQDEGDFEGALDAVKMSLKQNSKYEDSLLLKGQLLYNSGKETKAFRYFTKLSKKYPKAKRVYLIHLQLLFHSGDQDGAQAVLSRYRKTFPADQETLFSLAISGIEKKQYNAVKPSLEALLADEFHTDDVHLQLARIAELQKDYEQAIYHYQSVNDASVQLQAALQVARLEFTLGNYDAAARTFSRLRREHPDQYGRLMAAEADLLSQNNQIEEAMAMLDTAITNEPQSYELRYTRAMVAEKNNNLSLVEQDLRYILEQKPHDPAALNALGYTLADRTDRLDEARALIESAYAQEPNDAAITDSLGWVLYKLGELEEAVLLLEQAWSMFADPEVAAHYGEALWALEQFELAREIWQQGLDKDPDHSKLLETIKRLTGKDSL